MEKMAFKIKWLVNKGDCKGTFDCTSQEDVHYLQWEDNLQQRYLRRFGVG